MIDTTRQDFKKAQENISILIAQQKAQKMGHFRLSTEEIEYVLSNLLSSGKYKDYQDLGVETTGCFFGIYNNKHNKNTVIKLSKCLNQQDQVEKIAELGWMTKCQIPYIIKFHEEKLIQSISGTTFVVEEYEKCRCSLSQFLKEQKEQGNILSDEQKMWMAIQMMESVNYLHEHSILHRNINMDNFLVSENEENEITMKLSNFNQAGQLEEDWLTQEEKEQMAVQEIFWPPYNCLISSKQLGSLSFYAPERFLKPFQTSKKTDLFSVGLCVALLDNYMTFTENDLSSLQEQYSANYQDNLFKNYEEKINKISPLFPLISSLLEYYPSKRRMIKSAISKTSCFISELQLTFRFPFRINMPWSPYYLKIGEMSKEYYPLFFSQIRAIKQLSSLNLNLNGNDLTVGNIAQDLSSALMTQTQLSNFELNLKNSNLRGNSPVFLAMALKSMVNLSSLNLNISQTSLDHENTSNIFSALTHLTLVTNLSNLNLSIARNNQYNIIGQSLLITLKACYNLVNLNLNLLDNMLEDADVEAISKSVEKLTYLSSLNLNLMSNKISAVGAEYLSTAIRKMNNLLNLKLNFEQNKLKDEGVKSILDAFTKLTNLSTLDLNYFKNNLSNKSGVDIEYLSKTKQNLPNLISVKLSLNDFDPSKDCFKSYLNKLISITNMSALNLNLKKKMLSAAQIEFLPKTVTTDANISHLDLDLCHSNTSNCLQQIEIDLNKLSILSSFNLNCESCFLNEEDAESISEVLKGLTNISSLFLNLQHDKIKDDGARFISIALSVLNRLSNLDLNLNNNNLSDIGVQSLSKALAILTNIQSLQLNFKDNNLTIVSVESLSEALYNQTNILSLSLNFEYCKLGDDGAKSLSKGLLTLVNLSNLNLELGFNQLSPAGAEFISNALPALANISSLTLNFIFNNIGDVGAESLLNGLKGMPKLSIFHLNLNFNKISSTVAEIFQNKLSMLLNLKDTSLFIKQ